VADLRAIVRYCTICAKPWEEHTPAETRTCIDKLYGPAGPPGRRGEIVTAIFAHEKCEVCGRTLREHSIEDRKACDEQQIKQGELLHEESIRAVFASGTKDEHGRRLCPVCGKLFEEHSFEETKACVGMEHAKIAHWICSICDKPLGEHSEVELKGHFQKLREQLHESDQAKTG
jgi:hypothetical protein